MNTMPTLLDDKDWEQLIRNIKKNQCTPFLGAGMSYSGSLRAMAFTPDDKYIVTGSNDRFVRVALLQVEDLMDIACKRAGGITEDEWTKYFESEKYQ